jgi:NAD(P)-dependent dehydrogenase (short-subunit alcohol dehydrogenase family)
MANMVAIITGAGSSAAGIGNGRASAILLAEAGCNVVCSDISIASAQETVSMIETERSKATSSHGGYGKAIAVQTDVTDEAQCKALVAKAVSEFGRLDVLINNVGIGGARGTAVEVNLEEWERDMRVNVLSMVMMSKYAIPEMLKNEGGHVKGSIVNLGSVAGLRGGTPSLMYPTSKGAVVNMTVRNQIWHTGYYSRMTESNGSAPRSSRHSGKLRLSGHALHSNDVRKRHVRGIERNSARAQPTQDGGQWVGLWVGS